MSQVRTAIERAAKELGLSPDDLMAQGLRCTLERQLREVQAQIFQITGSYGVSGVEDMEARYRQGTLEEATSWRDLQRLDHLEYKEERLARLLETATRGVRLPYADSGAMQ
jgi:hypothetical protein